MAEMDTSSGGGHKKGPGVKKAQKKSTKVDLTPMVDLGFLLITFFVFTTTMSQPTAMNMNEPNDKDSTKRMEVRSSGSLTLLLGKQDQVYYYYGQLTDPNTQFKNSSFKEIRKIILDKKKSTPIDHLMYVIKADKDATFKNSIDILDEMTINAIPPGHYAEVDISDGEAMLIHQTEEANGIK
ncbi:MAG: biopolymer transporter ExbD [Sphingobacteriales bacterium]|nr:biopolymer transporter ExbD [Sphingobacteriales bacterium]